MKKHLSYWLRGPLFFILLLLGSMQAHASHIVGMDLYYTYVSGNTYKITVVAYGDCGPSSAAAFSTLPTSTPVICIYDGNTYTDSLTLAIQAPVAGVEITPVCPGVATQCVSPASAIPGIKKFVYSANYTLPHTSRLWRFVFTSDMGAGGSPAGRAAAITNIFVGTNTELVDTLNNTVHHNSNPVLTVVPTPFFCLNNSDGYNPGAVDPDADSLAFYLVPAINGAATCTPGSSVTYTGGYSGAAPLGTSPGSFSLNAATGQILFFPNILQRALVVYNIEEYRNDTLIGSCQREMTFLVQNCTNPPPGGILSSASAGTIVDSTDFKICSNVGAFNIYMNPTEPDAANNITVSASGLPTGATFTTVNNGTNHPNCTISWNTTGVAPGTYVFYVTFTDNNCPINGSETRSYTIRILPSPTISTTGSATVCAGVSHTIGATGGTTYAWSPTTGLSCTTCASPVATLSATTLFTVTGTAANGCTNTDTVGIIVNPLPTISAGTPTTICPGTSTTLTPSGGVSYVWSPGATLSCTTCTNPVASPSATTVYSTTGTSAAGCTNTGTVTITVDVPNINAGPDAILCAGSTATLTPSGGVSYVWSGAGLSCSSCTDPVANPAITTTYTVTGTDAAGCHGTDTVRVARVAALTITAAPIAICVGASGSITATGAATYVWSPGTGLSCTACASPVASPSVTTVYTITGTSGSCTGTGTTSVIVNALPHITAFGTATRCLNNADGLSASGGVSYVWSPSVGLSCTLCTSPVALPSATSGYTVTGTDANGCQNKDSVLVTILPLPTIDAGTPATVCAVGTTTLTPSGGVSYVWSGTGLSCSSCTSPVANPLSTTIYTVVGTDANGCSNQDTVRVTRLATVVVSATGAAICVGASATLIGSGATTYTWSPGTGLSCTACTSPSASPSATTTYTLVGTIGACTGASTVTVTVNPLPVISVSGAAVRCVGTADLLTASGGTSYGWSPGTGLSCISCAATSSTPGATTTYTVTGYNAFGCSATASATVTINPLPVMAAAPATICDGSSATLTVNGAVDYSWSPGTGLDGVTGASVTASPTTTTTYTITGTDANNCVNRTTVTVTVNPIPVAPTVVSPVSYCENDNAVPLIANGDNLLWYTVPDETTASSSATPTPATNVAGVTMYYVSQTVNGCQSPLDSIKVSIIVNATTAYDFNVKYGCFFDTVTFINNSQNVTSYLWSFGDGATDTATNPVHYYYAVKDPTQYIIKLDGFIHTCYADSTVDSFVLAATPQSVFLTNMTPSQTIQYGQSLQLNVTGAYIYYWIPNDGTLSNPNINNPVVTPVVDTTYKVYGMDKNGCKDSATVRIDVITDQESIPDAFTPNNDGLNDYFHVVNLHYGKLQDMFIYNRWGQQVFHTNDNEHGWDGKFQGVPQDIDVYNYLIIISRFDGTTKVYKGNLTLLR